MIIYISGGITNVKNYKEHFAAAEKKLQAEGFEVINPAKLELPKSCTWDDYMKITIDMLEIAEGIYMLNDWKKSAGACIELGYAKASGMIVMKEEKNV